MSKPPTLVYQNGTYSRVMNLKYKSKYKKLKRQIKNLVFENAALCDEVAQVQTDLTIAREERRYLIKRLLRHEGLENLERMEEDQQQQIEATAGTTLQTTNKPPHVPKKRGPKKRIPNVNNEKPEKNSHKLRDKVSLDAQGKPMFPINLYSILIHAPGEIIPVNPNFHNEHWIYPVGYVTTRIYAHPKDPQRKCVYTCKILNNAGIPQFQAIPDNDLDSVFFGESANVCHQGLLEALQRSLSDGVKLPQRVQGEKFFGLANATVKSLLQMDPGFKLCANFKGFIEQDENDFTACEDKDPTMNFDALQSLIAMSAYRTMPEVKDEPPDELLNFN